MVLVTILWQIRDMCYLSGIPSGDLFGKCGTGAGVLKYEAAGVNSVL